MTRVDLPDNTSISYSYDPFHRRLTKTSPTKAIRYLYDGNNEIGFEENGRLSFRILGSIDEIGSAVGLNLNGAISLPLHDLQGNVAALLNPTTLALTEEYRYSPFGEQNPIPSQNPWRYLSKHTEFETGLVFFGRRFYDPTYGRWLTQDPKGYTDSLNLYAFALNDPFTLIDPYGLENEAFQKTSAAISMLPAVLARDLLTPIIHILLYAGISLACVTAMLTCTSQNHTARLYR